MGRGYGINRVLWVVLLASMLVASSDGYSSCLSSIKGKIVYDVAGCKQIVPEKDFDFSKERYKWIKDLDTNSRKNFFATYRGLYLKGTVVKSFASQTGVGALKNALEGEVVYLYMPPSGNQCPNVLRKRLTGQIDEECCDGGGDAPCLLGSSYKFLGVKSLGEAGSGAGDDSRAKAKVSKTVKEANQLYAKRQWRKAAIVFEKAWSRGEMDVKNLYRLGHAYRELDNCPRAVKPLREIYKMQGRGKVWADEEPVARKAIFLLARCYSKMNDPQNTVYILNGYLLEAGKYKQEIKDAIRHKDFGWIHTSKEYRDWKTAAQKKL